MTDAIMLDIRDLLAELRDGRAAAAVRADLAPVRNPPGVDQ